MLSVYDERSVKRMMMNASKLMFIYFQSLPMTEVPPG